MCGSDVFVSRIGIAVKMGYPAPRNTGSRREERTLNPFVQQLCNLGPARLAAMAGVAVGLIGLIIFFATRFSGAGEA